MSRRIHKAKPSDGLRHRSWAATTASTGKEEEEEEKKYGLPHNLLWAREEKEEEEDEEERDLLHNSLWAREEKEKEEEEGDLLHNTLWVRREEEVADLFESIFEGEEKDKNEKEEEVWILRHQWAREGGGGGGGQRQGIRIRTRTRSKRMQMCLKNNQEEDSNSVSPFDSNNLEVVSGIPPVEQEVEREKTSATPSPTGDQDSAITEELKQATKLTNFVMATTKELKQATKFTYFATETTEELKQATKFSYFATALAGGGILSLLVFHLENKNGEPHTLFFKALTSFVLATFVSGLSIILLTTCAPPTSYQMPIIRGLVSASLVFLALTGVGVSIVLLKTMSELAFVPAIVVVIVACIIVQCKKTDLVNIDRDGRGLSNHYPCEV